MVKKPLMVCLIFAFLTGCTLPTEIHGEITNGPTIKLWVVIEF